MSRYCVLCGSELIIGGNDMLSDMDEQLNENDDTMITNATCPKCHTDYFMTDSTINERDEDPLYVGKVEIYNPAND